MMEFELPHEKGGRRTRQRMLVHRLWSASTTTPQARAQGQGFISSTSTDTDRQLQIIPSHVNSTPSDIKVSPEGPVVPVITVGHVFSSIPKGRTPLSPKTLEAATFLGLEPLLAAATGLSDGYTEEFIDIASHTDPFNAVNILHSEKVLGRRVLFVEKGAAIQLVSGKGNILQAQETLDRLPKSIQGFISLFGNRSPSSATNGLPDDPPTTCGVPSVLTMRKGTRPKPSNPLSVPTNTEEEPFRRGQHKEWERYGVPHLAKLPVRLALSLLCGLPERFLFLGQKGEEEEKNRKNKKVVEFDACDRFSGLKVHMLEGVELVLHSSTSSCSVSFVPAFLSDTALRGFWKKSTKLYAEMVLLKHRNARREVVGKLAAHWASVAAGAGVGGVQGGPFPPPQQGRSNGGGGGGGGDVLGGEESDGEPAEVMEVISELMGGGVDPLGNSPSHQPMMPPPIRPFVRAGAQFMCGAVTAAGMGMNWFCDILDRLLYFYVPNGWKVLGGVVPAAGPPLCVSTGLDGLLQSMYDQNKSIHSRKQLIVENNHPKSEAQSLLVPAMLAACLLKLGIESIDFHTLDKNKSMSSLLNIGNGGTSHIHNESGAKLSLNALMSMPISLMSVRQRLQKMMAEAETLEKGGLPPEAIALAMLQQIVPLLEYNAFHSLFPWCYNKSMDDESLKAVSGLFTVDNAADNLDGQGSDKRVVLEPRFSLRDTHHQDQKQKQNDNEKGAYEEYEHFTQCKALVLIGSLDGAQSHDDDSLQPFLHLGVPVGLDDGSRYIAR